MKKTISFHLKRNWVLLLILFAGSILRIIGLNAKSIWYDEACSVDFFQNSWPEIFSHRYMLRPLYFIVLKLWTGLFGYKEFILRIPSVFFGLCSIFMVYGISKKIFNKKVGLFSAFLLSISGYHIIRSQDARGYTLLMLLACVATSIFWNIIKNKKDYYFAYIIIMILMFLTNFFAAFIIFLLHNLFFLFNEKKHKRWILFQCLILIASVSIILPFLKYYHLEQYNDKFCPTEYEEVFTNMLEDFSYARKINQGGIGNYGVSDISMARKANYYILISLFIYALVRYFIENRVKKKLISKEIIFLLLWVFVPITVFLITDIFIPISKWSKSAIIILPAFYILISVLLTRLSKKLLITYVLVYTVFSIYSLEYIFSSSNISSWGQITDYVKENISEKEMILFTPAHLLVPFWYYYKYEDKSAFRQIGDGDCGQFCLVGGKWQMEFSDNTNLIKGLNFEEVDKAVHEIESLTYNYQGVWLIISPWIREKNMEILIDRFSQYYLLESSKEFPWQSVWLYHFTHRKSGFY